MTMYRIQHSYGMGWILRQPNSLVPVLSNKDKGELINLLPAYFSKAKDAVVVHICDEWGKVINSLHYGCA